ncbi:MAG: ketopantoate reductase family protein [Clostridiales bacterium]|nr:ketopantoate reductase family protein [Clostridiales bacterium]
MEIKKVSIIGLGALGILVGHRFSKKMAKEDLRIVADEARIKRYREEGVFCSGERCDFNYVLPEERTGPSDLIIFAVKFGAMEDAIKAVKNQVGPNTLFVSLLNGITSEEIIAKTYPTENIVYTVAQGMDAVKEGNRLTYMNAGVVFIGHTKPGELSPKVQAVAEFFEKMGLPYKVEEDIKKRMWGKFMLNVGINQAVSVFGQDYSDAQNPGQTRDVMIAAMREVIPLAEKENIGISLDDIPYWLKLIDTLNPQGKPSMRQDVEAKRTSEVEMLAGAVLMMSNKYGIKSPINEMLYEKLKTIESTY